MGLIRWIKETWNKVFLRREASEVFNIELPGASRIDGLVQEWYNITGGNPPWIDPDDDIVSVNFAQFVSDVTAGLVTLDLGISLPDTPRGRYLQKIADYVLVKMDERVSSALGNAGIVFKPNGTNVDFCYPGSYVVTEWDSNKNPRGMLFISRKYKNKKVYTKFEYQRFEEKDSGTVFAISNRAYVSDSEIGKGDPCSLKTVAEWAQIEPDVYVMGVEETLFSYYGNPKPNFIDRESPMKIPIWANCLKELRDLDIAWSRKGTETEDSKHITVIPEQAIKYAESTGIKLPRFMKGLQMSGGLDDAKIHEHVATLLTEQRLKDINSILAMISTKMGYDQGFFVLDEKTGMMTATQVEADDQSTIRTVKNLRDPLQDAVIKLLYGANVFADIYTNLPVEEWTSTYEKFKEELSDAFNWGDITYSYEEDKAAWWKYRVQGDVPAWKYYAKFEGMSEDDAKAMIEEANQKSPTLFE